MLKQTIRDGLDKSMKEKSVVKTSTLRMLISAIKYFEIAKKGSDYQATEEEILEVIGKEAKKRKEAIEMYKQGKRPELAEKEKKELGLLQVYLPKQMDEAEIRLLVKDAIAKSGATTVQDMGKVMGILMPQVKGKTDGSLVGKLVREVLS